jgi:hypothetical protein
MSIYEEFNEINTQDDYLRVKHGLEMNLALRQKEDEKLQGMGLSEEQIATVLAPIDLAISCAQASIEQWESKTNVQ